MNNKFQVLTNIYVCTRYFIGFTFLENVAFLFRCLPVIWQFCIHKSQHNMDLLVFVRKLVFLKFLQEFQAARNFSKVSLHFNKMSNSLRQVLQMYSETCIFCVVQKIVLQKQLTKIDLKAPGRSCDEI